MSLKGKTKEDFERIFEPIVQLRDAFDTAAYSIGMAATDSFQGIMVELATLLTSMDSYAILFLYLKGKFTPENEAEQRYLDEQIKELEESVVNNAELTEKVIERWRAKVELTEDLTKEQEKMGQPDYELPQHHQNASSLISLKGPDGGSKIVKQQQAEYDERLKRTMDELERMPKPVMVPGSDFPQ